MELMESGWTGRSAESGIQGVCGGGDGFALRVGVSGSLVLHSPKVPHPDFSVKVIGHNGKIYFAVENFR